MKERPLVYLEVYVYVVEFVERHNDRQNCTSVGGDCQLLISVKSVGAQGTQNGKPTGSSGGVRRDLGESCGEG